MESQVNGSGVIDQMIRERAYEIAQSDQDTTPVDNWMRAEAEIRAELEREIAEPESAVDG